MSNTHGTITRTDDGFAVFYPSDTVRQQQQQDLNLTNIWGDFGTSYFKINKKTAQKEIVTVPEQPAIRQEPATGGFTVDRSVLIVAGVASLITIVIYTLVIVALLKFLIHSAKKMTDFGGSHNS